MSTPTEELEKAVLKLPRRQRASLIRLLVDSLEQDDEISDAWKDEVERRLKAYESGAMETRDADEVFAAARERVQS